LSLHNLFNYEAKITNEKSLQKPFSSKPERMIIKAEKNGSNTAFQSHGPVNFISWSFLSLLLKAIEQNNQLSWVEITE